VGNILRVYEWFCDIDWNPEAITAAATVVLTILTLTLALGTAGLWVATRRLVREAENTSKRQLRAYVSGTVFHISSFDKDEVVWLKFRPENAGLTPARKVVHHAEIFVAPEPLPDDYAFPAIASSLSNPANIFPKHSLEGRVAASRFFTTDEVSKIIDGSSRIYCCGEIFYEDVFGKKDCRTGFCACAVGEDRETMKKLASGYRRDDLKIFFQIARTGNFDT
jgi:hypothetical protein